MAVKIDRTDTYAPVFAKVLSDGKLLDYLNFRSPVLWTRSYCRKDYAAMGALFRDGKIPVYEIDDPKAGGEMTAAYRQDSYVTINRARYNPAMFQFYAVHETTHLIQDQRAKTMKHWEAEAEALFAEALAAIALRRHPDDLAPLDRALFTIAKRYLDRRDYYESRDFRKRWDEARAEIRTFHAGTADQSVPFDGLRLAS